MQVSGRRARRTLYSRQGGGRVSGESGRTVPHCAGLRERIRPVAVWAEVAGAIHPGPPRPAVHTLRVVEARLPSAVTIDALLPIAGQELRELGRVPAIGVIRCIASHTPRLPIHPVRSVRHEIRDGRPHLVLGGRAHHAVGRPNVLRRHRRQLQVGLRRLRSRRADLARHPVQAKRPVPTVHARRLHTSTASSSFRHRNGGRESSQKGSKRQRHGRRALSEGCLTAPSAA